MEHLTLTLHVDSLSLSPLLPQECHILNSVAFRPAFFSDTSSLCFVFPAYLTVASHGDSVAESVFASHLFYCSTSVKSEADVHLIKHNTLVINSCLHQLRHIDRGLALQVACFISAFRENARNPRSMIAALSCLQCAYWSHSTFKSLFTFQAPASWINSDLKFNLEKARRKGCIVRSSWKHALVD